MTHRTVCITGASRGIGKAAALRFAAEGYDVAISCRKETEALQETEREILKAGSRCLAYTGDMGSSADCGAFFDLIRQGFGRLDVLVNNAGISLVGLLQDMTDADWDLLIRSDLSSVFYLSRLAVPLMLRQGAGKIINVSSVWGTAGASCEVAYSAAKGGVNAFTKALAKELAPSNIQVNAAAFGAIDTAMNGQLSAEEKADLAEEIPAGRFGTPEEAADLIYRIADSGPYLTGQIIGLNGGWQC